MVFYQSKPARWSEEGKVEGGLVVQRSVGLGLVLSCCATSEGNHAPGKHNWCIMQHILVLPDDKGAGDRGA